MEPQTLTEYVGLIGAAAALVALVVFVVYAAVAIFDNTVHLCKWARKRRQEDGHPIHELANQVQAVLKETCDLSARIEAWFEEFGERMTDEREEKERR